MRKTLLSKTFLLFFLSLFVFGAFTYTESDAQPIIYLEWLNDPETTMNINWIADAGSGTEVEYRERGSSDSWQDLSASPHVIPGNSSQRRFSALLSGLSPATSYEFRIPGGSTHYFRTVPSSIEDPLRFVVGGDLYGNRPNPDDQALIEETYIAMNQQAAAQDLHFAVWGGDLAHDDGDPNEADRWIEFLGYWYEYMKTPDDYLIPIVVGIGNHEVPNSYGDDTEDAIFFQGLFDFPADRGYGVLDFGNYMSLVMLDSDHSTRVTGAQTRWLEQTLEDRRNILHVFPVYHVSGWPAFRTFRGVHEDLIRNNWHPVFRRNRVRTVFEHHDHIYKRTRPIGDCSVPINNAKDCDLTSNGVIYTGGGAWGSAKRSANSDVSPDGAWYHGTYKEENNFVLVEITNRTQKTAGIGSDGDVLDQRMDYVALDAPEVLGAEDVEETSFLAAWDAVDGATRYRLDVARDEDFTSFLEGFENRDIGDALQWSIDDLEPNRDYYYRVRAQNHLATSGYSDVMTVALKPEPPVAQESGETNATRFTVSWEPVERATNYQLDLSTNPNFGSFVEGFESVDVGNVTSITLEGLNPGTTYYYRVRAQVLMSVSENSNAIQTETLPVDENASVVEASQSRILANDLQEAMITITVVGPDGQPMEGVDVTFTADGGESSINRIQDITGENGEALFSVRNATDEDVVYTARVGNLAVGDPVIIEFLPDVNSVQLGHNFPNPFDYQTSIPVTVPENTHIELVVTDVLGKTVRELENRQLSPGYYEIIFNGEGLSSGIYFYRLFAGDQVLTKKMLLVQ